MVLNVYLRTDSPDLLWQRGEQPAYSVIDEVVVCDTIPLSDEIKSLPNVRTLTLSGMLAEAIRRISNEESISAMFEH